MTAGKAKAAPPQPQNGWQTVGAVVVDGKIEIISYSGNPNHTTPGSVRVAAIVK